MQCAFVGVPSCWKVPKMPYTVYRQLVGFGTGLMWSILVNMSELGWVGWGERPCGGHLLKALLLISKVGWREAGE